MLVKQQTLRTETTNTTKNRPNQTDMLSYGIRTWESGFFHLMYYFAKFHETATFLSNEMKARGGKNKNSTRTYAFCKLETNQILTPSALSFNFQMMWNKQDTLSEWMKSTSKFQSEVDRCSSWQRCFSVTAVEAITALFRWNVLPRASSLHKYVRAVPASLRIP